MNKLNLRRTVLLSTAASAAFILGACTTTETKPPVANNSTTVNTTTQPPASPTVANPAEAAIQKLIGTWDGPEGTYAKVTEKMGADGKQQNPRKFAVELKDLDKAETFEGTAKDGAIEFTRKGKTETLKASTGVDTGMKGYEKETNCVVVTKGSEGYCKKDATAPAVSPAASVSPAAPVSPVSPANKK